MTETSEIIDGLAKLDDQLSESDRRYLAKWKAVRDREGDAFQVNRLQLQYLRELRAKYGGEPAPMRPRLAVTGD